MRESTASDYRAIVKNHLEKAPFYAKPVDSITEGDIETFIIRKREKFAESTCTHIKNAISNSFKRAIRARIIRHNPCSGLKIPKDKRRQETKKLNPYSQEEIETLLRAFEGNHYYPLVLFLARTGCRAGEAAGLKWEDLDLDARKAHIRRGFVRGKLSTPKSGKDRFIDLSPALAKELRKLKLARQKAGDWVFQNTAGGHVDMNNFRNRVFWPTVEKAGLRRTRLHDLRHSYASILIAATKDLYYIQRQLGHHSIKVTVDRYGHLLDDKSESRIVDVLDGENFDQKRTLYAS